MHSTTKGFMQISNALIEALLRTRLTGVQWRVLLWVIRNTLGWNRRSTSFTWYRLAKQAGLDRAATYRAGRALLRTGILFLQDDRIGLQLNPAEWTHDRPGSSDANAKQLWIPGINDAASQRRALSPNNTAIVRRQPIGCPETSFFRRAKDHSKDKLKTYKDTPRSFDRDSRSLTTKYADRRLAGGAARPIPRKYDRLS